MVRFGLSGQDKRFLKSLAYGTGVVLFWKGIWEGAGQIPIIENPWVSLFIGLLILTLTGWIFGQFDVFSTEVSKLQSQLDLIIHKNKKGRTNHKIYYYDELTKKHHEIPLNKIKRIESSHLVLHEGNRESFIPLHRISHIKHGSKTVWKGS